MVAAFVGLLRCVLPGSQALLGSVTAAIAPAGQVHPFSHSVYGRPSQSK